MPLQRRIPKRGFNNIFKKQFGIVNVRDLERFDADVRIDRDVLVAAGIVSKKYEQVKILGEGNLSKSITVSGMQVSKSAKQKIEAAGGKIEE